MALNLLVVMKLTTLKPKVTTLNTSKVKVQVSGSWRDGRTSSQRGYGYKWQKYREGYLRSHPLCEMCQSRGKVTEATVVDHIEPHKGDQKLFWNPDNHQALCKQCHDSEKQRLEKSGTVVGCDESGMPIDPNHYWSR